MAGALLLAWLQTPDGNWASVLKILVQGRQCQVDQFRWQDPPRIDRRQNRCPRVALARRFARPAPAGEGLWASRVAAGRTPGPEAPPPVPAHTPAPAQIRARSSWEVSVEL